MSTYKRRIVYLSDEEWEGIAGIAKERKVTISALIREALARSPLGGSIHEYMEGNMVAAATSLRRPSGQAERDALLNKINRGK